MKEQIVLLQQIAYACRKANGDFDWECGPDKLGKIELDLPRLTIKQQFDRYFADSAWSASGRYTAINGIVQPKVESVVAGSVNRWRLLHAGARATVNLTLRKATPDFRKALADFRKLKASNQEPDDDFIGMYCPEKAVVPQFVLASDGLTRNKLVKRSVSVMQPGTARTCWSCSWTPATTASLTSSDRPAPASTSPAKPQVPRPCQRYRPVGRGHAPGPSDRRPGRRRTVPTRRCARCCERGPATGPVAHPLHSA